MFVIGLMSGTSVDGVDVAIVDIKGAPPDLQWSLLHFTTIPYEAEIRDFILEVMDPESGTVDRVCELHAKLGQVFAEAVLAGIAEANLRPEDIALIGSHGQTVWHAPEANPPATLQLGEAAYIVERTGIPVVSNFRSRDMAVGGQGAPLVAYVDVLLLTHETRVRAAQNIGGIANVTFLPPRSRRDLEPFAFDTGPGNALIDLAAARATDGAWRYDRDGMLAAAGQVDEEFLNELLAHPYFRRYPPKSTGRETFGREFFDYVWHRARARGLTKVDVVSTLTAFTARSIAHAYRDFLPVFPKEVIVSGGGVYNPVLMDMLRDLLAPARVVVSDDVGIPADAKEAVAFAILAYETWHGRPGNLPMATGARRRVILGQVTPASSPHPWTNEERQSSSMITP